MKKILLIGGAGYIGARLYEVLNQYYSVVSSDIMWFWEGINTVKKDYKEYTKQELSVFDVIIVLAGHSSVQLCNGSITSSWNNNITNFINLVDKVENQLIIYASSASVYGSGSPETFHTELNNNFIPINNYDITKYCLDQQAKIAILEGKKVIGLRFGTVNGWSPHLRVDLMINSMFHSAQNFNNIKVKNAKVNRAVLGIEDLCKAILYCINSPIVGIYNLASFNATVYTIAKEISNTLNVDIIDEGTSNNTYDFAIDTTLFQETYKFKFKETISTILIGLTEKYKTSKFISSRTEHKNY